MKTFFLLAAAGLLSAGAFAQNNGSTTTTDERIVLHRDQSGTTTIEIKDGKVFVDGEEIASANDTRNSHFSKKIIIENGGAGAGSGDNPFAGMMEMLGLDTSAATAAPRAMLGVVTRKNDSGKPGAEVQEVTAGSPAQKAALRPGDLITSLNGQPVPDGESLAAFVRAQQPGDKITIRYERSGSERTAQVTLAEAPRSAFGSRGHGTEPGDRNMPNPFGQGFPFGMMGGDEDNAPKLGITGEDLADADGVRVAAVAPQSAAAEAGLQEGDVIKSVGPDKIQSVDQLQQALMRRSPDGAVAVDYMRNGRTQTAQVVLKKNLKRKEL